MKKAILYSFTTILIFVLMACSLGNAVNNVKEAKKDQIELTISAAASLTDAFEEIKTKFEQQNDEVKITFNFGASGDLQQQISQGAPVDFFISAALDKFDILQKQGEIDESHQKQLLLNELVLITPVDSNIKLTTFSDLSSNRIKQIAIGTPESVPVGKYSKQALEYVGIWEEIQNKIVYAKDVREVLHYVDTGNVDAGLVYRTDAATSNRSKIVATSETGYHDPVIYPAGVIKGAKHQEEAIKFYEFLQSKEAVEILTEYGFHVLE